MDSELRKLEQSEEPELPIQPDDGSDDDGSDDYGSGDDSSDDDGPDSMQYHLLLSKRRLESVAESIREVRSMMIAHKLPAKKKQEIKKTFSDDFKKPQEDIKIALKQIAQTDKSIEKQTIKAQQKQDNHQAPSNPNTGAPTKADLEYEVKKLKMEKAYVHENWNLAAARAKNLEKEVEGLKLKVDEQKKVIALGDGRKRKHMPDSSIPIKYTRRSAKQVQQLNEADLLQEKDNLIAEQEQTHQRLQDLDRLLQSKQSLETVPAQSQIRKSKPK